MNLPIVNPIVKNVFLNQIIPEKLFLDLVSKKFNGYVYLVIDGKYGFEESVIILSKGSIAGAIYLVDAYEVELYGKEAINLAVNTFGHKKGMFDIFELTEDQLKLLLLFNAKINFIYAIKKKKGNLFDKIEYNETIVDNLLERRSEKVPTQKDVIENYGLDELLK